MVSVQTTSSADLPVDGAIQVELIFYIAVSCGVEPVDFYRRYFSWKSKYRSEKKQHGSFSLNLRFRQNFPIFIHWKEKQID